MGIEEAPRYAPMLNGRNRFKSPEWRTSALKHRSRRHHRLQLGLDADFSLQSIMVRHEAKRDLFQSMFPRQGEQIYACQ